MPDEYAAPVLLLLFGALFLWSKLYKATKSLEPFELELYKRCQEAGLGDAVETKEEIQQAGEIAQTLASEKEFSRKIKKRHLKARWLNKRLKNGKPLFAKETEARQEAERERQKAERERQKAEREQREAEEAQRRAEAARQRAVAERTRLFDAFPHSWVTYGPWEYLLQYDSIEYFDREKNERKSLRISQLGEVSIKSNDICQEEQITITVGSNNESIMLFALWSPKGGVYPTSEQMLAIYTYLVKYSAMPEEAKARLLSNPNDLVGVCERYYHDLSWATIYEDIERLRAYGSGKSKNTSKDASVVGRAAAGWAIAGPAGGVIGALSAVDKNNKNRKNNRRGGKL